MFLNLHPRKITSINLIWSNDTELDTKRLGDFSSHKEVLINKDNFNILLKVKFEFVFVVIFQSHCFYNDILRLSPQTCITKYKLYLLHCIALYYVIFCPEF